MMIDNGFQIIAHRGASGYRPENTMYAFQYAWDLGILHIECDLRYTKDKQIVIFHDSNVDRTTNGSGQLNEFDYKDLCHLDAGQWFGADYTGVHIPSLNDLFEEAPANSLFTLELKDPDIFKFVDEVVTQIHHYKVEDRVILSSFNLDHLARIKVVAPQLTTAALLEFNNLVSEKEGMHSVPGSSSMGFSSPQDQLLKHLRSLNVTFVCPPARVITRQLVESIQDADLLVRAWGLNKSCDANEMRNLIICGVDGMTTNFPDVLRRIYREYGKGY